MAACSNPEFDARTDTVYSLDTPSVTAKAYPGVNVVSWQPVAGAYSYNVTVYEEGVFKRVISEPTSPLTDIELVNGKKYTYYVEAVSTTNPGTERAVYAKNSRGEASVTAIVPPAGTSALELPAYESGYDGNTKEVKDDKFVVSAENVKISVDKGMVYVNIPTKAYLMYFVDIYDTDLSHEIPDISSVKSRSICDINSNNVNFAEATYLYSAGKYKVAVSVCAYNDYIYKYSEVEAGEIEIEGLGLSSSTENVSAKYLSDGKTARIEFTPAKKDGVYVPTSWYKVYRHVVGEYATTQISGAVKEAVAGENYSSYKAKYYIDDEIADTTKAYQYIVVVENDGKYGRAEDTTLNNGDLDLGSQTGDVSARYLSDGKTACIEFTPATTRDTVKVPTSWYKVYRRVKGETETTLVSGDVKENFDSKKYYINDEIADTAKEYEYIVVVVNNGKYGNTRTTPLYSLSNLDLYPETSNVYAEYLSDGKTARISFEPAKKDGANVPTSWYKVYRCIDGEVETTLVSTATNIIQTYVDKSGTKYYIYDVIADTTKKYEYIVVVENDGKYGKTRTATLNVVGLGLSPDTANVSADYLHDVNHFASGADNTVRITFTPAKKDGDAVPTSWYKVYRHEDGELAQTEITSATNKIMQDDADPNTYVIYDTDKSIVPSKLYEYIVVVECDGKTGAVANGYLNTKTKPSISIVTPYLQEATAYNDVKCSFSVTTPEIWSAYNSNKDVNKVKVEAYILVVPTTQNPPTPNEIIANNKKIVVTKDIDMSSDTSYYYSGSESNLSEGYAYVVVTATCDGYENAVSNVSDGYEIKNRD